MLFVVFVISCLQLILGTPLERTSEKDTRPLCPCNRNQNTLNTRVVGGQAAGRNVVPYATAILFNLGDDYERHEPIIPFCGGTLITDRHIVTAAHCLKTKTADILAVDVGDYSLRNDEDGEIIDVKSLKKFPEYIPGKFHTDIGIIELKKPVKFEKGVRTAIMANRDLELTPGTTVYVYGWGRLNYTGEHPDKLQIVDLPVVENGKCQKHFVSTIEPVMVCAGGSNGKDACIGDSGSGLIVQLDNDVVFCGVVSFGRNCALPGVPGVYTRLSSYIDWILENTQSASCRPCIHEEHE